MERSADGDGAGEGGDPAGAGFIAGGLVAAPPAPPPPPASPPAPPAPRQPVRIGGAIRPPDLVYRVEPVYPLLAMQGKVEGVVILEATVDADGCVQDVKVLHSIKLLDQPAIDAVRQWRYAPLLLNGVPATWILTVTLRFSVK